MNTKYTKVVFSLSNNGKNWGLHRSLKNDNWKSGSPSKEEENSIYWFEVFGDWAKYESDVTIFNSKPRNLIQDIECKLCQEKSLKYVLGGNDQELLSPFTMFMKIEFLNEKEEQMKQEEIIDVSLFIKQTKENNIVSQIGSFNPNIISFKPKDTNLVDSIQFVLYGIERQVYFHSLQLKEQWKENLDTIYNLCKGHRCRKQ